MSAATGAVRPSGAAAPDDDADERAGARWRKLHAYRARVLLPGWSRVSWNAGRAPA
jgi:hypothetical protein